MLPTDGLRKINVGSSLRMASISDLLFRLLENAPEGFTRRDELESLHRIYCASSQYSPLEDEAQGDQDMPGLAWLCERSVSFQFAAAYVIQGVFGWIRLFVDALRRVTEAGVPPPQNYFSGDLSEEELDEPEVWPLLDALERLAAVRGHLPRLTRTTVRPTESVSVGKLAPMLALRQFGCQQRDSTLLLSWWPPYKLEWPRRGLALTRSGTSAATQKKKSGLSRSELVVLLARRKAQGTQMLSDGPKATTA